MSALLKELSQGTWSRPTDKSAVYLEIAPGDSWGIRVTLIDNYAKVEAVDGPKGVWYKAPDRYSTTLQPPRLLERLSGITLEQKIMAEVQRKRLVAQAENARLKEES
ncbi:MAG: hypothetical protein M0R49_05740 [Limnochordia bacterium]|nr:hypothetical protein [Limnochordia bacterium]